MRDTVADLSQRAQAAFSNKPAGLTQDNLGLHDKLAFAANQAALEEGSTEATAWQVLKTLVTVSIVRAE